MGGGIVFFPLGKRCEFESGSKVSNKAKCGMKGTVPFNARIEESDLAQYVKFFTRTFGSYYMLGQI